jgi:hypothetical protein
MGKRAKKPPGHSDRTPGKHDLLNRVAGKLAWVAQTEKVGGRAVYFIDLCAGDGIPVDDEKALGHDFWNGTSPGILIRQAGGVSKKLTANVDLYEISRTTFDRLIESLERELGCCAVIGPDNVHTFRFRSYGGIVTIRAIPGNGLHAQVNHLRQNTCVLVNNDPNTQKDWAMRPTFVPEIRSKTWMCTTLSTMGCNVGGLLRMSLDERQPWYSQVMAIRTSLPAHQNIILAAIDRDPARWAYLVTPPTVWTQESARWSVQKEVRTCFRKINREMRIASLRDDPDDFEELQDILFLRNAERLNKVEGALL